MINLQSVIANALWIVGLAAVLATFSYMDWWRRLHGWRWSTVFKTPRMQVPLCLGLELTCLGIGANGFISTPPAPLWNSLAWSILAILFVIQIVIYSLTGRRRGWDAPVE